METFTTLIPVRDRTVAASGMNHRFSANARVIIDAGTRLVVAAGPPVPGHKALDSTTPVKPSPHAQPRFGRSCRQGRRRGPTSNRAVTPAAASLTLSGQVAVRGVRLALDGLGPAAAPGYQAWTDLQASTVAAAMASMPCPYAT